MDNTMKRTIILCLFAGLSGGYSIFGHAAKASMNDSLQVALEKVDDLVERRESIHRSHEARLDSLKREMRQTGDLWKKYHLCGSLFYEYLHYQADSSLYYVGKKEELLPRLERPDLESEIHVNRAEVMGVMGQYDRALAELQSAGAIPMTEGMRKYYYSVFCAYYGWRADYTSEASLREEYRRQASLYRDSILMLEPEGVNHDILFGEQLLSRHTPEEVITRLQQHLRNATDKKSQSYLHYTLSEAYAAAQDTLRQMYHLTRTSMLDLETSVREYAALQELAWLLYQTGDTERAYRYVACSLEDATACNARLRLFESGQVYPVSEDTFRVMKDRQYVRTVRMLVAMLVLFVLLVVTVFYLVRWMKKLIAMRKELSEANEALREESRVKNTYIVSYLDRCVGYLGKQEQYRRALEKLAMASQLKELFRLIRDDSYLREERKEFYADFDRTFLGLFPNFVHDLNELVETEEPLSVRPGELLSTELRIFALIRLGVTDTSSIAHFLSCSLTTVYNYRSKMRNRAVGDKETFEERVAKL